MESIIHQGPDIKEAFDVNTQEAHNYSIQVERSLSNQYKSFEDLDH